MKEVPHVIGIDLGKSVFQVHAVDETGRVIARRRLRRHEVMTFLGRYPSTIVALEACATSHFWAREIGTLGHEVRMIAPQYARAYVKTNKNDAADAEAICEAAMRPTMRFVRPKSADQQAMQMLHRARDLLIRQRTMLVNALRGHLAEFGVTAGSGIGNVKNLLVKFDDTRDKLPKLASDVIDALTRRLADLQNEIEALDEKMLLWHRSSAASSRLAEIPGVGPVIATALVAKVGDASQFASARHFAAWLGLVPRGSGTGGKIRLGSITKRGDGYLRRLIIHGARAVLRWIGRRTDASSAWLRRLLERRPVNVAVTAYAHKIARIAWAMLSRKEPYRSALVVA
ncbi:MAG: IS110 family transposase [Pseudolabrys sp.]|nr:IS110 family transposase [Pseudolabrys sp.]